MAEAARLLPAGSPAERELTCHLHVAARHALELLSKIAGTTFEAAWVLSLIREGRPAWERTLEPMFDAVLFGGSPLPIALDDDDDEDDDDWQDDEDEDDDETEGEGWKGRDPAEARRGTSELPLDERDVLPAALRTVAALLDLLTPIHRPEVTDVPAGGFEGHLVHALNGATKVVSHLLAAEWENDWPSKLLERGRDALPPVLAAWQKGELGVEVTATHLDPLEEVWLVELDPVRTPDADRAAERVRRERVTEEAKLRGDLLTPRAYVRARLDRLAASPLPEHVACARFAREPRGTLILQGEFRSALNWIQWAIGRHWFVDELETVRAFTWRDLVSDNLLCQERAVREAPRLLVVHALPVYLMDGGLADPGQADRLLAFRLERQLPTVVALERTLVEALNLTPETRERLAQGATTIRLPVLTDPQLAELGLEL